MPCLRTKGYPSASPRRDEDDRLRAEQTALGAAETQHVDAAVGRDLAQTGAQRDRGVGQSRPVDVQQQAALVRDGRQRRGLSRRVNGAQLRRLADRHRPRLHVVLVANSPDRAPHELRSELAVGRGQVDELAAGEALGGAALVDVDVRRLRADDGIEGPQDRAQRGDVAAGAVEDGEALDVAEQLAHALSQRRGPGVVAVGGRPPRVGLDDRLERRGVGARVVVAREHDEPGLDRRTHAGITSPGSTADAGRRAAHTSAGSSTIFFFTDS